MTTPPKARKFRIRPHALPVIPETGLPPAPAVTEPAPPGEAMPAAMAAPEAAPASSDAAPPQSSAPAMERPDELLARIGAGEIPAAPMAQPRARAGLAQAIGAEPGRQGRSRPARAPATLSQGAVADDLSSLTGPQEDGFGPGPFPGSSAAERAAAGPEQAPAPAPGAEPPALGPALTGLGSRSPEEDIAAIRAEGLTGRQLRMARRVAQRHAIEVSSDYDAVRLLRQRGIDPFERSNMLDLVVAETTNLPSRAQPAQLPARNAPAVPPEPLTPERRASEIRAVQLDLARRRRRRFALMMVRLAFFVLLPTLIVGWYFYRVATPLYATHSEFVIQQADSQAGSMSSLFTGTQFATSQDSITVQGYLQSREAMRRLDADLGFRKHWSQPGIDEIQRLAPDASEEAMYATYKHNVRIGYDPTEGIIKMEVVATDPEVSAAFSRALIGYAEEQVDHLTQRMREDQMRGARESYEDAEQKVQLAQSRVLDLQEQMGVMDPVSENSVVMSQISTFEIQLGEKRLALRQLQDNPDPNPARVTGTQGDIVRLEALIRQLRANLTQSSNGGASLAAVSGKLRIAEAELETRQLMLSQAAQQMEVARIEANKQVRYLSTGVKPLAPDQATYPRAGENTLVALLIFSGIYLMMSLTASILREQVSA